MGIEQSREVVEGIDDNINKHTQDNSSNQDFLEGRDSPRPSITSEVDLPYVSYTVNRPIGDSPKHSSKGVRGFRSPKVANATKKLRNKSARPQEIVVVREAVANSTTDPELARIQLEETVLTVKRLGRPMKVINSASTMSIPTFLPIIRGALTAPSVRDPEVLERLDTTAFRDLCRRYQVHLFAAASLVSTHQEKVNNKIRQGALVQSLQQTKRGSLFTNNRPKSLHQLCLWIDLEVGSITSLVTDRQRAFARHAEKLSQVNDVSRMVSRCHTSLNQILETMEALNEMLPVDNRLEPFVWTTG